MLQWDTSNNYSNGTSEEIIGKAIKKYNLPRHKLILLTKCLAPVSEHENVFVVPYAEEMRKDKKYVNQFGYIGASSMRTYQFAMMQICAEKHGWAEFISMQNQYSLNYREEEREMNRFCNETVVGLIPWGPLDSGRLARSIQDVATTDGLGDTSPDAIPTADAAIIHRVEDSAMNKGWFHESGRFGMD
ncbi:versiconal hemiacetal acetate reductase [Penicillium argentinense]|uniref:Versiconal hemiacetal acetate reductase n=1 Tax=Penicillium argentinense TaxID=1131581 RepID=A0A9W9G301_9EURO|nr:versiconal hemiacetal acetate reductase [Penicillium argentinense]KAJ5111161.1 versiconal hemiacetal acetate reductase [Penicillium argentinense]